MKDYYNILNIPASATPDEVKKAFRKLALIYHPDKNDGSKLATGQFAEIKEAYEVLRDKKKRADYNYSLYADAKSRHIVFTPFSSEEIIIKVFRLQKNLAASDPFRIDTNAILFELESSINAHHILLLQQEKDEEKLIKFIDATLFCCRFLPLIHAKKIAVQLQAIHPASIKIEERILTFIREQTFSALWNRYKIMIAFLVAIILCIGIYFSR